MNLKFKKLSENAIYPKYAHIGDAGFDLTAISVEYLGSKIKYGTGLAFEIPEGYVGLIFPRSSIHKSNLRLSNCVGVIDSSYRGEVLAIFDLDHSKNGEIFKIGDRIAQMVIMPYASMKFEEVQDLSTTIRGIGGFGSTGV